MAVALCDIASILLMKYLARDTENELGGSI